jgi:GNAT superfamily N-acetyltransferase
METLPTPVLAHDPFDWAATLALIQRAFAGMEGRIDPPSSLRDLTADGLCASGAVWVIGAPPVACMILAPHTDALYLGKLAVDPAHQGHGLGRAMVAHAIGQARALGLPAVELQTRVELVENHAFFTRVGFVKLAETAHPGYLRPTSFTYRIEV